MFASRRRAAARMSAHVCSQVLSLPGSFSVWLTGMPRAAKAAASSCVLRAPVNTR